MVMEESLRAILGLAPHPATFEPIQTTAVMHPAYVEGKIEVRFGSLPCPMTRSHWCDGYQFPLQDGYMVPIITLHDPIYDR